MSTRRDDDRDLLDHLSEGLAFYPEAASVAVDADHMRTVIEIARRALDAPDSIPDLTETAVVQVGETPRGYALFRKPNEAGGHTYWSDEIGGGVMIWDTCLVSAETLRLALSIEAPAAANLRESLAGISPPVLRGDNLAIFFASTFEPGVENDERDDTGTWAQESLDEMSALLDAIHAHYAPHISGGESPVDRPTEHRPNGKATGWQEE